MIKTVLELEFKDAAERKFTLRVDDPKADLDEEMVSNAMRNIVNLNVFSNRNVDIVESTAARKITTTVSDFNIA